MTDYLMNAGQYKPVINLNTIINLLVSRPRVFKVEQGVIEFSIEFPDISFWQGDINWDTMAGKNISHIIIRAGQRTWPDRKFYPNWLAARRKNIRRSVYWFYDGTASPQSQFAVLDSLIHADPPEGVIWIDWETNFGGAHEGLGNVVALMELVEKAYPNNEVGMYTGYYFFIANSNAITNRNQYAYLAKHPLWLAQYGATTLRVPKPWTVPELHQYGTPVVGLEYGCQSKELDMNRVVSNFPRYKTGEEPTIPLPPIDEGEPMPTPIPLEWRKVTASVLNIRTSPGASTTESDIGNLPKDTLVQCDSVQVVNNVTWYHIVDAVDVNNRRILTDNGSLVSQRNDCWVSGYYLVAAAAPPVTPPLPNTPTPPQEIRIKDRDGIWWKCTVFERVT